MFQSCLKDQTDFFEESPSERMQAALDNARKVLTSSPEGWIFEYFPDRNLSYGGYVYTVKFDDEKATVGSEIAPGEFVSSYYKFTNDNGPMLVFDTYNSLMHYFAIPSSGNYQAKDGDYEFVIMDVTDDVVKLRGKRTGNTMYLRRLTVPADEYLNGVADMNDNLILNYAEGTAGGKRLEVSIDPTHRIMLFASGEDLNDPDLDFDGDYYLPTPTGISFLEPVTINGIEITALDYDYKTLTYSGNGISFTGEVAPDFAFFSEFEGEFTVNYNNTRKATCTLVRDVASKKVYFKGLNANYDVVGTYDPSKGCINICSQQLGEENGELIWLCAWALDPATGSGTITWSTDAGMYVVKDPENPGTYKFVNNANSSYNVTSFSVYYFTGSVGGQPRGQTNAARSKWYLNGYNSWTYLSTMVKNNID